MLDNSSTLYIDLDMISGLRHHNDSAVFPWLCPGSNEGLHTRDS